jgi:hypothetical protein
MKDLTELYCRIDDFWKQFKSEWEKHLIAHEKPKRGPEPELSLAEMMTIIVFFHQSNYRTFKHFYGFVTHHLKREFPNLISYSRFVYLMKMLFVPLFAYLLHQRGKITGIAFIDSTSLAICHVKRAKSNKVFQGLARKGRTSSSWFYGFKLHLIINEKGEILAFQVTPGNCADVAVADQLSKGIFGKLFGDRGYISLDLAKRLFARGLHLFTALRSNMKQKLLHLQDKILLRKRAIIETVNDQLKNISQIEHTRHRSIVNFLINLLSGLVAYTHQAKKPSLKMTSSFNRLVLAA